MIGCQNFIVTVNIWSVYRQVQALTQAFNRLTTLSIGPCGMLPQITCNILN